MGKKEKGERYGFKLQWVRGPPRGLRILGVAEGSVLEQAGRAAGVDASRLAGGIIVSANGVSENRRLMDAELDRLAVDLIVEVPAEQKPLLGSEEAHGSGMTAASSGSPSCEAGASVIGRHKDSKD